MFVLMGIIFTLAILRALASLEFVHFIGYVWRMSISKAWRRVRTVCWIFVISWTSAASVQASQGAWVETRAGAARLVAAQIGGQTYLALQLDLQDGWHTYWRYPGASGIAPVFDISAPYKVGPPPNFGDTVFPAPHFFDDGVGGFFGYQGKSGFVFPFAGVDLPMTLRLDAQIGICREICIPVALRLDVTVDAAGLAHPSDQKWIANLLDQQPKAPSDRLSIGAVSYDGTHLRVTLNGDKLTQPYLMIAPDRATILGPIAVISRQAGRHIFELSAQRSPRLPAQPKSGEIFAGQALQIVARNGKHAIQQTVIVPIDEMSNTDQSEEKSK
jgi:DsbC/DsbD-like thiol-disulfide interchange protein